ncbi:MAG: diguanylate cyclase [Rhizobiales bacterium]|nr:diguanylate cyclase [Hyphomicrobiales bacterium]
MNPAHQQYHDTLPVADAALGKIGALGQPADPRSYALWFKYASGESGLLSAAMNSRLARNGTLTAGDIEDLHDAHIAPARVLTKTNRIGTRLAGEIDQILATVEVAEDTAGHFTRDLANAAQRLASTVSRADVRAIIDSLVQTTRTLAQKNARLQTQLQAMSEEIAQLRREIVDLRAESQTDPLTGLGDRRFFLAALERSILESRATGEPMTLLLADVDRIKLINENYGNIVGDRVLRFIAMVIKEAITGRDIATRYGDDAFAIILPKTSLPPAVRIAEQLRHAVMKCELVRRTTGEKARLTLSVGVATLDKGLAAQGLIEAAEMCLYAAKRAGRNNVISEADEKLFAAVAGSTLSAAALPYVRK